MFTGTQLKIVVVYDVGYFSCSRGYMLQYLFNCMISNVNKFISFLLKHIIVFIIVKYS